MTHSIIKIDEINRTIRHGVSRSPHRGPVKAAEYCSELRKRSIQMAGRKWSFTRRIYPEKGLDPMTQ